MADQPPPYPGGNDGSYPKQPLQGYPPQPQPYQPPPPQAAYPPPGGAYPPPGQPTTVVVNQPTVSVVMVFREAPIRTNCPHCRAEVVTATHYESGTLSWLLCIVLCIIGCNIGCCLIPFCVEGCQDVIHTCPNCRQQIGRWNRM